MHGLWIVFFVAALALCAPAARADLQGPWVTTDRTVDCSSLSNIVAGVIKPGMTEEQKAIALFTFYRQMVYHYHNLPESRDPVKCINVMGNTLCGSQGTCMKGLLEAAGIKARVVSAPGHTYYQAFYDGKWHTYDTFMNFYVFTRGDKPNVADSDELKADPSLADKAVEEGRAVPGFLPCGDTTKCFVSGVKENNYTPMQLDWSVKDYALRPGEEIVRTWWPHGYPLPGSFTSKEPGPMHTCGKNDQKNPPDLFQFWQPYAIRGFGGKSVSYRHYVNGWMVYAPDLSQPAIAKALAAGELEVPVKCPFYITGTKLAFEAACPGAGDAVEVSVSADGKAWTPVLAARDPGTRIYRTTLGDTVVKARRALHAYRMKFALKGKATLAHFNLKTIFWHNAMAAPQLMPGKNRVTLTIANPDALKAEPLTVVYRYKDAPNWSGAVQTVEKTAGAAPFTFDVDLPQTEKLPQMQDLTLRCGTLAWAPPAGGPPPRTVFDFADAASVTPWAEKAGSAFKIRQDGQGMLVEVAGGVKYPQISSAVGEKNWSAYEQLVVEVDNESAAPLTLCVRLQSNDTNDERTDVELTAEKGRNALRAPLAAFKKTKASAVTRLYLMPLAVPEGGAVFRVRKIALEPKAENE